MKYSVIIPVYRAETTIEKCLRSLLAQPHDGVELLLVNDGSPDRSGEICERFAAQYDCIRYFCKENGGVSTARNLALDNARGEYVLFVDSDDYVREDYFAVIDALVTDYAPELAMFSLRRSDDRFADDPAVRLLDSPQALAAELRKGSMYSLCTKAFRREIIGEKRFDPALRIAEDLAFVVSCLPEVRTAAVQRCALYIVNDENSDSLSRAKRADLAQQLFRADRNMMDTVAAAALTPEQKAPYEGALAWLFYRSVYSSCKELQKFELSNSERRTKIREICRLYAQERVRPRDWKCALIALPVRLRMSRVLDLLAKRAAGN